MKRAIELFYRDGNNDKSYFIRDVDSELLDEIMCINEDEFRYEDIEMEEFGWTMWDIPAIQEWGYDDAFDHNFVSIVEIDGRCIKELENEFNEKLEKK